MNIIGGKHSITKNVLCPPMDHVFSWLNSLDSEVGPPSGGCLLFLCRGVVYLYTVKMAPLRGIRNSFFLFKHLGPLANWSMLEASNGEEITGDLIGFQVGNVNWSVGNPLSRLGTSWIDLTADSQWYWWLKLWNCTTHYCPWSTKWHV